MQASAPSPKSPTLKPPFFGGADIVFQTLTWVYLLLMATQIIISLGNRPQGSVVLYRLILAAWMLIMGVILALVGTTLYQVFNLPTQPGQSFWNVLISNSAFRATLLGLGSTYGLWWLCSFLFLDPWHMFNSFLQYMFLMPFWVNVLQTYAMCNTHGLFALRVGLDNAG